MKTCLLKNASLRAFVNCSFLPGNMGTGIDEDRFKVFGELWSFLLTVLNDIIGQVQEGQLPVAFSCTTRRKQYIFDT